jgi:hypothetical protein
MRSCTPTVTLLIASAAAVAVLRAQAPEVEAVVDKARDYVVAYERDFVGLVAEESYRQDVKGGTRPDPRGFPTEQRGQRRDLKSDVLLVRAPAGDRWLQFRDVFEVDGKPVRDRPERLAKLFLQPSPTAQQQVEAITAESARYNIGGINRNVNLPTLALAALEADNRPWFTFTGSRKKDSPAGPTWELEYREERMGTLIRTAGDQALPVRGRFLVEGATGRVLSSELVAESPELRAQIDVTYAPEPAVGLLVPREMREKYMTKGGLTIIGGQTIEGRATYSNYRRYKVTTEEKVK